MDIKERLSVGLLELVEKQSLESITIKQLLAYTKISKQTFYNHFLDKNNLLSYIYNTIIIPDYDFNHYDIHFKQALTISLYNMKKYHKFMKEACLMEGEHCLKEYIYEHCKDYDLKWHQYLYGKKKMSDALKFATIYHANASTSMILSWILSDMPVSCEEMAELITKMRSIGMDQLFEDGEHKNPYI